MLEAFSSYLTSNEEQDESIVKMNIEMKLSIEWWLLKSKWTIISLYMIELLCDEMIVMLAFY